MSTDETKDTPEWPPPWARSIAFFFGLGMIFWETVIDKASHLVVYGIAFILTGLPIARGVEKLLDKLPWGQASPPPPQPSQPQEIQPAPKADGSPLTEEK